MHPRGLLKHRVERLVGRLTARQAGRHALFIQICDNFLEFLLGDVGFRRQQLAGRGQRLHILAAEGLCHADGKAIVKVDDALSAVLVVLVGLQRNAGQRRIALNVVGLAQKAVAGGKAARKQLDDVDLGTGRGQRVKIKIVDVDISLTMRSCLLRLQNEFFVKLLGTLTAVLEHGAHGRVAVNIAVFPLDVGIDGVGKGQLLVNLHQARVHLAHAAALGTIQNVVLGHHVVAVFHEHPLDDVLNVLNGRRMVGENLPQPLLHLERKLGSSLCRAAARLHGLGYGRVNLGNVIGHFPSVSFHDGLKHNESPSVTLSKILSQHLAHTEGLPPAGPAPFVCHYISRHNILCLQLLLL